LGIYSTLKLVAVVNLTTRLWRHITKNNDAFGQALIVFIC